MNNKHEHNHKHQHKHKHKHTNDDTCTGHTPDVWICQNPECGDKLTAETIGRDGEREDAELFCTSCASRDVRLIQGPQHVLFREDWPV